MALVLLFLQPCQSSYCYCQEVLDRLIQCGLLVAEEVCSHPRCQRPGLLVLPSTCKPVSISLGLCESCQFACVAKVLFIHPASTFPCELGYLAQVALGILLGFPDLLLPAGPGPGLRVVELIPAQPYQVPVTSQLLDSGLPASL